MHIRLAQPLEVEPSVRWEDLEAVVRSDPQSAGQEWQVWLLACAAIAMATCSVVAWWSQRRRANLLAIEAQRFRDVFDNARDVLFILSTTGRIQTINRAVESITGLSAEALAGTPFRDLASNRHDRTALERHFERVVQRRLTGTTQIRVHSDSGGERILELSSHALPAAGAATVIHGMARDVTMRKQLEEGKLQTGQIEAVSRLSGTIAHDFNNILTIIRGQSERLREDGAARPEDAQECLDSILNATRRAELLTLQLSGLSRRQAQDPELLDLHDVIVDTLRCLGQVLPEDIALQHYLVAEPPHMFADRATIEQILLNIALNARDAMPNGGTMVFETRRQCIPEDTVIRGEPIRAGNYVVLTITDNGDGMDDETAARVFEPFFTTKHPGRGTGLGLATVRSALTRMGGYAQVQSQAGEGTAVTLYLPWSDLAPRPAVTTHPARGRGEKILLIEDDPDVLTVLARTLQRAGYEVVMATSAEHALRSDAGPFDAVVTEVALIGCAGATEFIGRLRAGQPSLPVILTSSQPPHFGTTGALPRTRFLKKPLTPAVLREELRALLDAPVESTPGQRV